MYFWPGEFLAACDANCQLPFCKDRGDKGNIEMCFPLSAGKKKTPWAGSQGWAGSKGAWFGNPSWGWSAILIPPAVGTSPGALILQTRKVMAPRYSAGQCKLLTCPLQSILVLEVLS